MVRKAGRSVVPGPSAWWLGVGYRTQCGCIVTKPQMEPRPTQSCSASKLENEARPVLWLWEASLVVLWLLPWSTGINKLYGQNGDSVSASPKFIVLLHSVLKSVLLSAPSVRCEHTEIQIVMSCSYETWAQTWAALPNIRKHTEERRLLFLGLELNGCLHISCKKETRAECFKQEYYEDDVFYFCCNFTRFHHGYTAFVCVCVCVCV
jgi:hypothetical protein